LKHRFIPVHTKLGKTETKEILEKYNVTLAQLPKISLKDPVIETMKCEVGDLIRIERQSPTMGTAVYYRVVVK
ncbi:DNA-directed RNA polymerase subunit H, partial [Candidatus Woesearchaeota archaeon]|nr:DNA-directed RNA polymerase subunit H [Candidatus Woesearchaeota archaeon]